MNKKVFLMAALAASVGVFSGCSDDDGPAPISVDGATTDAPVVLPDSVTVGSVLYTNGISPTFEGGKLSLNLPETVASGSLYSDFQNYSQQGYTVSDPTVKSLTISSVPASYYKGTTTGTQRTGYFMYSTAPSGKNWNTVMAEMLAGQYPTYSESNASAFFVYVDKDVTISRTVTDKRDTVKVCYKNGNEYYEYQDDYVESEAYTRINIENSTIDLSYKTGWNFRYTVSSVNVALAGKTVTITQTGTQTSPSAVSGLNWYFQASSN
ncbi:hypothetical protein AGMMS49982_24040 [Bacteroidia bacterium]|nr:hypothetical protein AGMMS49982_24040 [Bacteroidia bacterium]